MHRNNQNKRFTYTQYIGYSSNDHNNKQNKQLQSKFKTVLSQSQSSKRDQQTIAQLQQKLRNSQMRYRQLQQITLQQQMNVLEQISLLQNRFTQVTEQKQFYKHKFQDFTAHYTDFQKIKGISDAMINMMHKVQGRQGDLHEAWKWIKKIVAEYQTIKKKALQWKEGFDAFKALADSTQSQYECWDRKKTFSNCSYQQQI